MGGKLVKAYSSMHWLTRVGIVLVLSIIVLAGSLIIALAGSEIGYHSHTPAPGSVIGDTNPAIAVNVVASEGLITESDVRMTLDGIPVTSELATAGDEWIVSYIPADKLADGDHTVAVEVYDSLQAAYEETQWNFTVDAAPKIINLNPASESIVSVSNPVVSFTLRDTFNKLNGASLSVLLDGSLVDTLLRYQGYPEYDACGNEYWIAESYQEATVSFQASGLAHGPHTVEITVADTVGNVLHETWSFTVAADIAYSEHSPADGEVLGYANPVISVKALALEGTVTPEDVHMTVGGAAVEPSLVYDAGNYIISYTPGTLDDGYYPVTVDIFNPGKGIYESTAWSFTVDTALTASDWNPGKDGTTSVSNPLVSVYVKSGVNRLDPLSATASLNGSPVAATFMYKGYWVYDACGGKYVIESYKEGTVSFETAGLANGFYNVEVRIANTAGNELVETWSFSVKTEIKFSEFSPTEDLTTEFGDPEISVWAYEGVIDKENIIMLLDGNEVEHTVTDLSTGIRISHKPVVKLDEGVHNVIVNVYDSMNEDYQSTSWSFNVDARPKASEWVPARGSTVATASPDISVLVTDTYDNLDETSVTARLNGQPVSATFDITARYDACGGFLGYNYRQGTVKFNASALQDGVNLFEISISDVAGNMLIETCTLTVAEAPKISSLDPADGTEVGGISKVSAVVVDNTAVDWDSVKLYINNSIVAHTVNESTGEVAYNQEFPDVSYQVMLEASDTAGNQSVANWSFITVASPPTLTVLEFFSDNITITDGVLKFYAKLNHQVDMKDNATLKLNGTPLEIDFRFQGYTDACTGYYIILSKKEAYISYEKVVGDGQHTLELFAEDKFGNSRTWTWSLQVLTPPSISNLEPVKYGMEELQPTISATVTENDTIESIVFKLNGVTIDDFSYNPADGKFTYVPPVPLENETKYTASLAVTDGIGLTANKTWQFVINNYPDMADSNISNCTICHQLFSSSYPSYGPFEDVHRPKLNFGGSHNNADCDRCHSTITYPPNCGQCHYGDDECNEGTTPHGYSPDIAYSAKNYDPSIPLRVMQNREMWDCIICHQPGAGTKDRWGQLLTNHDIPELHKTSTEGCADCHALSLTREHARPERVDDAGGPVTCATCHQSAKTEVQAALANGDTSCAGCHSLTSGGEGHAAMHNVSFGAQCVTCHGDNMMTEKVSHNNNCDGCHNSPDPVITSAIQLQNRTCFGCHTQPHGIQMSVIRDDMPRYEGVSWSRPDPAIVWSGEGWLPDVLINEMARVMFSARAEFDASEVYQYYRTEMGLKGWSILEDSFSVENASFRLLYKKGRRHCLIWMYGGPNPLSGTSGPGTRRILNAYN